MSFIKTLKNKLKLGLLTLLLVGFFGLGTTFAANDLLKDFIAPAKDRYKTTVNLGENVDSVGKEVFEGRTKDKLFDGELPEKSPSLIVRTTRLLLSLVIALSITMILYNGMKYILDTMNGKDGKSLVKNVIYIAVGIIIALFSVVIMTIIQSIPKTLEEGLNAYSNVDQEQVGEKHENL